MDDKIKHVKDLLKAITENIEDGECFEDETKMRELYEIVGELKDELKPEYWFWIKQDRKNRTLTREYTGEIVDPILSKNKIMVP